MNIDKLKKQKAEFESEIYGAGEKDGRQDAEGLDYKDFVYLAAVKAKADEYAEAGIDAYKLPTLTDLVHKSPCWEWLKDEVEEARESYDRQFDDDLYLAGWLAGVLGVWAEVEQEL